MRDDADTAVVLLDILSAKPFWGNYGSIKYVPKSSTDLTYIA